MFVTLVTGEVKELTALPTYTGQPIYGLSVRVRGDKDEQSGDRFDAMVQLPLSEVPRGLRIGAQVEVELRLVPDDEGASEEVTEWAAAGLDDA